MRCTCWKWPGPITQPSNFISRWSSRPRHHPRAPPPTRAQEEEAERRAALSKLEAAKVARDPKRTAQMHAAIEELQVRMPLALLGKCSRVQ